MTNYQSLEALCTYLGISKRRIVNDPSLGRSVIRGKKGHVYVDDGYFFVVEDVTKQRFTWIRKKHLSFMELVRIIIADEPLSNKKASVVGEFRLNRMPTTQEAKAIRRVLQIREKRVLTEEQKKALVERFRLARGKRTEIPSQSV